MRISRRVSSVAIAAATFAYCAISPSNAWLPVGSIRRSAVRNSFGSSSNSNVHVLFQASSGSPQRQQQQQSSAGNLHGQNACFLPLKQLDTDYYAPRIVQIAGAYPGLTKENVMAVTSEPAPDQGQWTYDFSDPDGPQLGTVAIEGSAIVANCQDPIVIIAEHPSIGVELPKAIKDPVDLLVLVDRSKNTFAERKFLVVNDPNRADQGVKIVAFASRQELPEGIEILGHVEMAQIPWLPAMSPTKTGFMEADEYF